MNETVHELKDLIEKGNATIIMVNGEVAGTVSFYTYGETKDSRSVVQIGKLAVLHKFRRLGLSKQLGTVAFDQIRQKFPAAVVVLHTKNDIVKKSYRDLKWTELDIRGKYNLLKRRQDNGFVPTEEWLAEVDKEWKEQGYSMFVFDPQEKSHEQA